jgi:HEAT repeat protein
MISRALVCIVLLAAPAFAGPPRHGKLELVPLVTALAGDDAEAAAKAAETLGAAPEPAAHEALLDALALGPPPPVASAVLAALAGHPAPPDVAALVRYASHRNPQVRASALATLALYPDPTAQVAIVHGLHDQTGVVRAAAAAAAAKGHVRDAIDGLFALLAKGEEPAARALAALADPDLARKIGDQLGHVPDSTLAVCLGAILRRADFGPDPARVEIVHALANISDPAAITALTDYIDATPKTPPRPSLQDASRAVEAKLGGGK